MHASNPSHWDSIYTATPIPQLGWHEPQPGPSLELIQRCDLQPGAALIDIGSGASTLLAALLTQGFQQVYALDFSPAALNASQAALEPGQAAQVEWLRVDITSIASLPMVDLWHDRAVFHFFTTLEERRGYLANLRRALRPGGYLVIAAFAIGGAVRCSGLPVVNYDAPSLAQFLGPEFELLESLEHTYQMPSGALRPYVYTRFQRRSGSNPAS